jgi:2-methylisocitrate lyase-like PEP mutase family enzyme
MTTIQSEKAAAFRALHEGPGAFVIPNPYDVGTTRILAALGFAALATTSIGCAFGLGRRDGAITQGEALAHARAIVEATPLPVSADLENGFGEAPEAAALTVRRAAGAGLVGCSIDDGSGDPARPIYDFSQAVERIAAAVEAARSLAFPFMLTARAENFLHGRRDLDDTIRRLQAFEAAGADVLFAPGLSELEPVRTVCGALSRPVNVLAGFGQKPLSVEQLAAAGARRISLGPQLMRAALSAFLDATREVKERGSFTFLSGTASIHDLSDFMVGRSS